MEAKKEEEEKYIVETETTEVAKTAMVERKVKENIAEPMEIVASTAPNLDTRTTDTNTKQLLKTCKEVVQPVANGFTLHDGVQ